MGDVQGRARLLTPVKRHWVSRMKAKDNVILYKNKLSPAGDPEDGEAGPESAPLEGSGVKTLP